jgi:hypothetical protein
VEFLKKDGDYIYTTNPRTGQPTKRHHVYPAKDKIELNRLAVNHTAASGSIDWKHGFATKSSDDDPRPRAGASSSTRTMAPMQPIPFIDLCDSDSDEETPVPMQPIPFIDLYDSDSDEVTPARTVAAPLRWETKADGTQVFLVDSDSD